MILDSLQNSATIEAVHPLFKEAFDYIKKTDFTKVEAGKIVLKGDDLYINVADIKPKCAEDAAMETHIDYIDIQVALIGEETMGWIDSAELKEVTKPYNAEKDITFFAEKSDRFITVRPGEFAVFFPSDGHAPGISTEPHRKLVVKVRV